MSHTVPAGQMFNFVLIKMKFGGTRCIGYSFNGYGVPDKTRNCSSAQ